jgi:hypothetical protein
VETDKKPFNWQHFLIIQKKSKKPNNDERKERVKKDIVRSVMELLNKR